MKRTQQVTCARLHEGTKEMPRASQMNEDAVLSLPSPKQKPPFTVAAAKKSQTERSNQEDCKGLSKRNLVPPPIVTITETIDRPDIEKPISNEKDHSDEKFIRKPLKLAPLDLPDDVKKSQLEKIAVGYKVDVSRPGNHMPGSDLSKAFHAQRRTLAPLVLDTMEEMKRKEKALLVVPKEETIFQNKRHLGAELMPASKSHFLPQKSGPEFSPGVKTAREIRFREPRQNVKACVNNAAVPRDGAHRSDASPSRCKLEIERAGLRQVFEATRTSVQRVNAATNPPKTNRFKSVGNIIENHTHFEGKAGSSKRTERVLSNAKKLLETSSKAQLVKKNGDHAN
ncbi:uncharacterized protein LOC116942652 isoform X1 [Petromyzon marinus]|uniref:uncharacterized protein LOC116942652 isoform X1 n=1 Tax=Petromyzon marinus TaxID=7757 RepID=UPI003F6EFD4E